MSLVLKKFNNKGRYAYDKGQTCGPFGSCNIYFNLCVKPSNYEPTDFRGCWYQISTRDKSHNAHSVDFKTVDTGIPKTLQIRKSKWPGVRFTYQYYKVAAFSGIVETSFCWGGLHLLEGGTASLFATVISIPMVDFV